MLKNKITKIGLYLTNALLFFNTIYADEISNNKVTKGLEKFIDELTSWLIGASLSIGIVMSVYCLIRAFICTEEMEQRKWKSHLKVIIICCVGVVTVNILLKVIRGYFT